MVRLSSPPGNPATASARASGCRNQSLRCGAASLERTDGEIRGEEHWFKRINFDRIPSPVCAYGAEAGLVLNVRGVAHSPLADKRLAERGGYSHAPRVGRPLGCEGPRELGNTATIR